MLDVGDGGADGADDGRVGRASRRRQQGRPATPLSVSKRREATSECGTASPAACASSPSPSARPPRPGQRADEAAGGDVQGDDHEEKDCSRGFV